MEYSRTPHSKSIHSSVRSDMLAEWADPSSPKAQQHSLTAKRHPACITDQPVLPRWRPRSGRTDEFIKWSDALVSLEADLDFELDEAQPCFQQLSTRYSNCCLLYTSDAADE